MPIWEPLLIYAFGTLWYGVFNWFWFWLWREQPLRESLSLLYRELADYCEAKYSLLTQHTDPSTALPPLLTRQQKVVDLITSAISRCICWPLTNATIMRLLRRFRWGWICRSIFRSACISRKRCKSWWNAAMPKR